MRRTSLALLAACLLAGATACGGDDEPSTKASAPPTVSKEDRYLAATEEIAFNGTPSTEELLAYPPQWCKELSAGHGVEWLFDMFDGGNLYPMGDEWGTKKTDANELLVAGVKAYCPENRSAVLEELRTAGEY
ncbi:hypothetical protein RB200_19535 [Streptomyces sp. PmtG]